MLLLSKISGFAQFNNSVIPSVLILSPVGTLVICTHSFEVQCLFHSSMSAGNEKREFALIPKGPTGVEKAEPGRKRILTNMVADALAIVGNGPTNIQTSRSKSAKKFYVLVCAYEEVYASMWTVIIQNFLGESYSVEITRRHKWADISAFVEQHEVDLIVAAVNDIFPLPPSDAKDRIRHTVELLANLKLKFDIPVIAFCAFQPPTYDLAAFVKEQSIAHFLWAPFNPEDALKVLDQCLASIGNHWQKREVAATWPRRRRRLRFVLLDDVPEVLEGLKIISQAPFKNPEIFTFTDAEAALQELEREDPDLFITDWSQGQPGKLRGEGLLQILAKRRVKYPVFLISASGELIEATGALKRYADMGLNISFVAKPYKPEDILTLLRKYVSPLRSQERDGGNEPSNRTPAPVEGDGESLYEDGLRFYHGDGCTKDYEATARLMRQAAAIGHVGAQYSLGVLFKLGRGVGNDDVESVRWYRMAAERGHAQAQNDLGWMLTEGRGVTRDYEEAAKWQRKSAEQGNAMAQFNLGCKYVDGVGVSQDYAEAVAWFRRAADQGGVEAQLRLGLAYYNGQGISQNYGEAAKWFSEAAKQGSAKAKFNLGLCFRKGEGVEHDDALALRWIQEAAEQGDSAAQGTLGCFYRDGTIVSQNFDEAAKWYKLAVDQGSKWAADQWGISEYIRIHPEADEATRQKR